MSYKVTFAIRKDDSHKFGLEPQITIAGLLMMVNLQSQINTAFTVQWGSEIRTSLDFIWSQRGGGLHMVWILNGSRMPIHLKSEQMAAVLSKTI